MQVVVKALADCGVRDAIVYPGAKCIELLKVGLQGLPRIVVLKYSHPVDELALVTSDSKSTFLLPVLAFRTFCWSCPPPACTGMAWLLLCLSGCLCLFEKQSGMQTV